MANIDERVVKLSMDDSSLQQGVSRVTKALEQLKKAFNFSDTKSFEELDKAAKKVKFDSVSQSASDMQKDVSKATSKAADDFAEMGSSAQKSVQQIGAASDNVNLTGVASAANKMSDQVQQSAAEANSAIGKIGTNTVGIQQTVDAIDGINDAANRVDLGPIQKGVENVKMGISSMRDSLMDGVNTFKATPIGEQLDAVQPHFKALEAIGVVAMGNLAAKAATYGMQLASNLTNGIRSGFEEYETQLNSVQTILANTQKEGANLTQVNTALNQLNTYADKTIYNFTEMTRNIGTFTAAGVDLQTSVNSIKGIANLAAISGSSSQQASTAMYQLSQALATGTVKLMDWNSVVNAGMGGQVFQDLLVQTSEKLQTGAKQFIAAKGSFRDSLKEGWLTSDVLTQSLNILAMDITDVEKAVQSLVSKGYTEEEARQLVQLAQTAQDAATKVKTFSQLIDTAKEAVGSGWSQSMQIIFGDFEEAKDLWTGVSDEINNIINAQSQARNQLLSSGFSSGYKQLVNEGIVDTQSFQDILTNLGGKDYVGGLVKQYGSFEKSLHAGWLTAGMLKDGVAQLTQKVDGYDDATKQNLGITNEQINQLNALNAGLQNGSISADDFAKKMQRMSGRENVIQGLANIWNSLKTIIQAVGKAWDEVMPSMSGDAIYSATEAFRKFTEGLKPSPQLLNVITTATIGVATAFKAFLGVVGLAAKGFGVLLGFAGKISGAFINIASSVIDGARAFAEYVKQSKVVTNAVKLWEAAFSSFGTVLKTIGDSISGVFDGLFDGAKKGTSGFPDILGIISKTLAGCAQEVNNYGTEFQTAFQEKFGSVPEIAQKVSDKVSSAIQSLRPAFDWIGDRLRDIGEAIQRFFGDLNGKITLDQILSLINGGLLTGVLAGLRKFIKGLNEVGDDLEKSTFKGALKKTLDDIGNSFKDFAKSFKIVSITAIAASIKLLADALTQLSTIRTEKVLPALGAMTAIITVMTGMMVGLAALAQVTNKADKLVFDFDALNKVALAMVALGASMKLMAEAAYMLKDMDPAQIAVIFGSMATAIVALGGSIALMGTAKPKRLNAVGTNMIKLGAGFVLMASSLVVLAGAILMIASVKPDDLARSMNAVGQGIVLLTTAMAVLGSCAKIGADYSGVGKNILLMATALIPLALAIKILGTMDLDDLAKGLGSIAIGLGVLAGAMAGLGYIQGIGGSYAKSAAAIMAFAAAMVLLAVPIKVLGGMDLDDLAKGVGALVITLGAFAGAMALFSKFNGQFAGMLMASAAILSFATAAVALTIPIKVLGGMDLNSLAKGLSGFGLALVGMVAAMNLMPQNMSGQAAGMIAFAAGITVLAVAIRLMGSMDIKQLTTGLIGFYGALVGLGFAGQVLGPMAAELMAVAKAMGVFGLACLAIGAGMALAGAGLTALAATGSAAGGILATALDALIQFIPALAKSLVTALIGVLQVIVAALPQILDALSSILRDLMAWLVQQVPAVADAVVTMIDKILQVVAAHADTITDSLVTILVAALNAVAGHAPEITAALGNVMTAIFTAIADSIRNLDPSVLTSLLLSVGVMALIFEALAKMKKDVIGALMVGGTMIGLMTALTGVFALMNLLNPVNTVASAVSLSTALIAMTGAFKLMETAKKNVIGALAVGSAMAAILAELALVFGLMSAMNIDNVVAIAASLSGTILAISATAAIMSLVNVGAAMSGVTALATFIAGLAAIVVAAGAIKQIPGVDWLVSEGAEFMAKIGAALGGFIGSIAGAITGAIMGAIGSSLPSLATGLSNFMNNLKPFIDGAKEIDGSVATAIDTLANVVLKLTASSFLNAITSFITGGDGIEKFGAKLIPLGTALQAYSMVVKGLDSAAIAESAMAAAALTQVLNALPGSDGLWQKLAGNKDWSTLSNGLVQMGMALKMYSIAVTGLQPEPINTSIEALNGLNGVLNAVPSDDGWWQKIAGGKDWSTLSTGLAGMGKALAGYSKAVSGDGVNIDAIQKTVPAVKTLNNILQNVPSDDGWWQKVVGGKSWGTLTEGLKGLGEALAGYGKAVSGDDINVGAIQNTVPAVKSLTEILRSDFSQVGDFGPIKNAATQLGNGLSGYYNAVSEVSPDAITPTFAPLRSLINVVNGLGGMKMEGTSVGFITAATQLGIGLSNYTTNVTGLDFSNISASVTAVGSLSKVMGGMPAEYGGVTAFQKAVSTLAATSFMSLVRAIQNANSSIGTGLSDLNTALSTGTTTLTESVNALNSAFSGINLSGNLSSQMSDAASAANSGANQIRSALNALATWLSGFASIWQASFTPIIGATRTGLNLVAQAISSYNGRFSQEGRSLSNSLGSGMRSGIGNLSGIFNNALSAAVDGARAYRGSFERAGSYLAAGLAVGISRNSDAVSRAAADAVSNAVEAAKQAGDINSPSRVMAKVGMWFDKGLENGIADNVGGVVRAAKTMMTRSIDVFDSSLSNIGKIDIPDFDVNPTITPVMDLSVVEGQAAYLNSMLSDTVGIGYSSKMIGNITAIPRQRDTGHAAESVEKTPQQIINNYDFTQNNTSPKALSRYDIYKQTRTQFRQFEQMNRNGGR